MGESGRQNGYRQQDTRNVVSHASHETIHPAEGGDYDVAS
jgi:hypothetical protein